MASRTAVDVRHDAQGARIEHDRHRCLEHGRHGRRVGGVAGEPGPQAQASTRACSAGSVPSMTMSGKCVDDQWPHCRRRDRGSSIMPTLRVPRRAGGQQGGTRIRRANPRATPTTPRRYLYASCAGLGDPVGHVVALHHAKASGHVEEVQADVDERTGTRSEHPGDNERPGFTAPKSP